MFSSLTNILMKIFAAGFYRMHSGMLVFLFGTVICYCFFINTLGSVPVWAFAEWNLVITLSLVRNPLIVTIFFLICLGYAFKSVQYIAGQLNLNNSEFLYYSTSSFGLIQQLKSWFVVQFNIFLPLWIYTCFAAVIGINYGHYFIPAGLFIFLLALTCTCAFIYIKLVNRQIELSKHTVVMKLMKNWNKPFIFLYTYHVFNNLKLTYLMTKTVSWVFMIGIFSLFIQERNGILVPGMIMLVVVTVHSILIYQEYRFNETFLYFSHNFPYSRGKLFLGVCVNFLVLMLPELLWFVTTYPLFQTAFLLYFGLSALLLFRSLMYWFGLNMKRFLCCVFVLFNIFFLGILYKIMWALPLFNMVIAYLVFDRSYLNQYLKD